MLYDLIYPTTSPLCTNACNLQATAINNSTRLNVDEAGPSHLGQDLMDDVQIDVEVDATFDGEVDAMFNEEEGLELLESCFKGPVRFLAPHLQ
jgi:hypothetical protein